MALRDDIAALYDTLLKRPADTPGVNYWENAIQSGQATLADVRNLIANSAEAQGLLGGGTTGGTAGAATGGTAGGGTVGGLLGGGTNAGIPRDQGTRLITDLYRTTFDRAPDQAGLDYWLNLLTSGQQTWDEVRANILRSNEAGTAQSQNAQAGIRQVPFGSQNVGGIVYPMTQMPSAASMPSFSQFSSPDAARNAFQQSLAYQAALPSMVPAFNPADIPPTYQQIAAPRQRLDIANVQIPDWLRIAAAKDEKRTDAETAALSGGTTTGGTGGITSTTPGSGGTVGGTTGGTVGGTTGGTVGGTTGGTVGGTTGGRSAADLQAFNTLLNQTYQTALGRPAETAGANYWSGLYSGGTPFQTIVNAIMNSPEAQARTAAANTGGLLGGADF